MAAIKRLLFRPGYFETKPSCSLSHNIISTPAHAARPTLFHENTTPLSGPTLVFMEAFFSLVGGTDVVAATLTDLASFS